MNRLRLAAIAMTVLPVCLVSACHGRTEHNDVARLNPDPPNFEPIRNDPTGFPNASQSARLSEIVSYITERASVYGLSPDRTNQMLWGFHFFVPVKFARSDCHSNIAREDPKTLYLIDPNPDDEKRDSFAKMSRLSNDILEKFKTFPAPDSHGEDMHSLEVKMCKLGGGKENPYICGADYLEKANKYGLQDPDVYPSVNDFIGHGKYNLRSQIEEFSDYDSVKPDKKTGRMPFTYADRIFFGKIKIYLCKFTRM